MSDANTEAIASAEVRHVIVRGCSLCESPRTVGTPCLDCGNTAPATVVDLGVVSASYRNPIRQFWWDRIGQPLAERRIRRANRRALSSER